TLRSISVQDRNWDRVT
nr:immunoglobulin heavy chain junction region [Mus musculus]